MFSVAAMAAAADCISAFFNPCVGPLFKGQMMSESGNRLFNGFVSLDSVRSIYRSSKSDNVLKSDEQREVTDKNYLYL